MRGLKNIGLVVLGAVMAFSSFGQSEDNSLSLAGTWKLTWADGSHGPKHFHDLAALDPKVDPHKYRDAQVPGEIHDVFRREGILEDPNVGVNTSYADWVADQYYQYYTTFSVPKNAQGKSLWLVFDKLDLVADIYLNGKKIGHHENYFYPCRLDVSELVREGENKLVVLLESGLYSVAEKEGAKYSFGRGLQQTMDKRHYLRKPQYQFNWDWNPRYVNVGITGDVRLEWAETLRIDQFSISQQVSDDLQKANLGVNVFVDGVNEGSEFKLVTTIKETGQQASEKFILKSGVNKYESKLTIDKPNLWYPAGFGDPFRYTLVTEIYQDKKLIASESRKIGFRKVEVDQSPHPVKGDYFTIKINNVPIFMKGANWVPADLTYSKVDNSKLDSLVSLAQQANFNMLRIWGGGEYASEYLLDLCDEKGIVVWHDFLFACVVYPGDDDAFYDEVRKEATWNVREMSHHPSIVIWAGNNEIEWIFWDEARDFLPMADYVLYEHLLPLVLRKEGIDAFYWPSSPHSKDKIYPNDPYTGDQHPWGVGFGKEDIDFYGYRKYEDRFADEGGVLGASSPATIKQMLPENQQYVRSFSWDHHDNLMNFRKNILGNTYRTYEHFLGVPYDKASMEDYLFGSSLLHAEGLQEYIYNYRRRKFSSSAAVFWMYSDSWPVTHGWTIVDYYLRKKLAFHPVRRAFDQIVTAMVKEGDSLVVYGVNDTMVDWEGKLQYGVFAMNGGLPYDQNVDVKIPANEAAQLAVLPYSELEKQGAGKAGGFAVLSKAGEVVSQNRLFLEYFKDLKFSDANIKISLKDGKAVFESEKFVWGATIDLDGESDAKDNCFDLLPGIPYTIDWTKAEKPEVLMSGNELMKNLK